jgi:hypothetical protein
VLLSLESYPDTANYLRANDFGPPTISEVIRNNAAQIFGPRFDPKAQTRIGRFGDGGDAWFWGLIDPDTRHRAPHRRRHRQLGRYTKGLGGLDLYSMKSLDRTTPVGP